jgi:hypothetical protein
MAETVREGDVVARSDVHIPRLVTDGPWNASNHSPEPFLDASDPKCSSGFMTSKVKMFDVMPNVVPQLCNVKV